MEWTWRIKTQQSQSYIDAAFGLDEMKDIERERVRKKCAPR